MTLIKFTTKQIKILLAGFVFTLFSVSSQATLTQVSVLITKAAYSSNTDCSSKNAYFDDINPDYTGFSACRISVDDNNTIQYLSNVIAKFNTNGDESIDETFNGNDSGYEESDQYAPFVKSSDWTFTNLLTDNKGGTWTYTGGYPDIRFWAAKSATDFRLFWMVDSIFVNGLNDPCTSGDASSNLTYDCMRLAASVTTGDWTTPSNKGLSHISFFGGLTDCIDECGTTITVPEPNMLILFSMGLFGLAIRRKYKSNKL